MNPNSIIKDIKQLKIQGAENVAKAAIDLISIHAKKQNLSEIRKLVDKLSLSRPTEPCMRNALKYLIFNSTGNEQITARCDRAKLHFKESDAQIAIIGERKIHDGSVIFTHCHSSTVIKILALAKSKGKKFSVICTETRPKFQGRKTAEDLVKLNIPTTMIVDSAASTALKTADLCLIGADAITTEGYIINKIGSQMIAMFCKEYDIPIYSCTNSWKFDPETVFGYDEPIEGRDTKEVWDKPPKRLKIINPAFDRIGSEYVQGIISEIGIYKPEVFVEELRLHYPWMLEK